MTQTTKQLYTYKSIDNKDIKTDCTNEQVTFPPSKLVGIKTDFVADVASKIGVDTLTVQDALKIVITEGFIGLNKRYVENSDVVLDIKDHSFNRAVALNTRNLGNNPAIIEAYNNLVKKAEVKADKTPVNTRFNIVEKRINELIKSGSTEAEIKQKMAISGINATEILEHFKKVVEPIEIRDLF